MTPKKPRHGHHGAHPPSLWKRAAKFGLKASHRVGMGALWTLAIAVLLFSTLAYAGLSVLLKPERLKPLVASQLENALQRKVTLDTARLLPWQGIRVTGLKVADREGFGEEPFLVCQGVLVKHRWLALLGGTFELKEARFWGPVFRLERSAQGEWNIGDLARRRERRAATLARLRIQDGEFLLDDRKLGRVHAARAVSLEMSADAWETDLPIEAAFDFETWKGTQPVRGRLALEGTVYDLALGSAAVRADLRAVDLSVEGARLKGRGRLRSLAPLSLEMDWGLDGVDREALRPLAALPAALRFEPVSGRVALAQGADGRFRFDELRVQGAGVQIDAAGSLAWPPGGGPSFKARLSTQRHDIARASRVFPVLESYGLQGQAKWSAEVSGSTGDVSLDQLAVDLSQAAALWKETKLEGVTLHLDSASNLKKARLRLDGGRLERKGQTLSGLKGSAALADDVLRIEALAGSWDGVPFRLRSRVQTPLSPSEVRVEGALGPVHLDKLVEGIRSVTERKEPRPAPAGPSKLAWLRVFRQALPRRFPDLRGDISIEKITHPNILADGVRIDYDLQGVRQGMRQMDGRVVLDFKGGRIIKVPQLMEHPFLRYVFLPFETLQKMSKMGYFEEGVLEDLAYERMHGNYRFSGGAMKIDHFFVQGPELTATAEGEVDWVDERLLLRVVVRVNRPGMGAPESLSDEKGRPTLAFFIEGPMLRPEVRMDLEKVKAGAVDRFVQSGLERSAADSAKLRKDLW